MSLGIFGAGANGSLGSTKSAMFGLGVAFGNRTSDSKVLSTQRWLNKKLSAFGYRKIEEDGKLGAATCGAMKWAFTFSEVSLTDAPVPDAFDVWAVCSSGVDTVAPTPLTQKAQTNAWQTAIENLAQQQQEVDPDLVKEAQRALNRGLIANEMCPITVDGDTGPATCGAWSWLNAHTAGAGLTQAQRDALYAGCAGATQTVPGSCPPTRLPPAMQESPVTEATETAPLPTTGRGLTRGQMLMGAGLLAGVGAAVYAWRKRKLGGA